MGLLLDTEAMLWAIGKDGRLSQNAESAILFTDEVYVSAISFFEVAIKLKISRKIQFSRPVIDLVRAAEDSGFIWLPVTPKHLSSYDKLPFFDHHRDPFDRLILATAMAEGLTVVSSDHNFPLYQETVNVLW